VGSGRAIVRSVCLYVRHVHGVSLADWALRQGGGLVAASSSLIAVINSAYAE